MPETQGKQTHIENIAGVEFKVTDIRPGAAPEKEAAPSANNQISSSILNGEVQISDWVISAPIDDYAYLIGVVTAIDKLGTPEHDTENEGDDIHVDFTLFEYPPERITEIENCFSDAYQEEKEFGELPLDDVIMVPESLIRITELGFEEITRIGNSLENCEALCKSFLPDESVYPADDLPDPAIGVSEMNLYGYGAGGMLPLLTARALELYDSERPVYLLYPDGREAMAFDRDEIENHDGIFGILTEEWQRIQEYAEQSAQNSEAAKEAARINSVSVEPQPEQPAPAAEKPLAEPAVQRKLSEMMGLDISKPADQDNKATPPLPEDKNKPVYKHPPETARQNGELDKYRESNRLNKECAAAIDQAVRDSNYELHHYDLKTAAATVTEEYGADRVAWVLANTIQKQHYDGRYSSSNQAWAKNFDIPEAASGFFANCHPVLVDSFLTRFREAAAAREKKPSILAALKEGAEKSKQQDRGNETKKSKEMEV